MSALTDARDPVFRDVAESDNDKVVHFHASLFAIDDDTYPAGVREYGRCRCGMWSYEPSKIMTRLFGHKSGQPYTLADYVATADADTARVRIVARKAPERRYTK